MFIQRGGFDRLKIHSGGVDVNLDLNIKDDYYLEIGTDADLRIYETASDVGINYVSGGVLFIRTNGSFKIDNGSNDLFFARDNAIELNYSGNKKLETTSAGVDVTGDVTLTDTDTGSSAGPELKLYRNSSSPADADYLIKLSLLERVILV